MGFQKKEGDPVVLKNPIAEPFLTYAAMLGSEALKKNGEGISALIDLLEKTPRVTHLPVEVVAALYSFSTLYGYPIVMLDHKPNETVDEKRRILLDGEYEISRELGEDHGPVEPLKTLTIHIDNKGVSGYFLVVGLANFALDGQAKRDLSPTINQLLGTEGNIMNKGLRINPSEFDPDQNLDLTRGIVSPFVRLKNNIGLHSAIRGVLYYKDDDFDGYVALGVSHTKTIIVDKSMFEHTLFWWQERYLGIPYKEVSRGISGPPPVLVFPSEQYAIKGTGKIVLPQKDRTSQMAA